MKTFTCLLAAVVVAFLATGCGDNSSSSTQPATPSTNYLSTLASVDKNSNKTIDVSYLNSALQLYQTQEGHYPKTLDELKPNYVSRLPVLPVGCTLDYDSTNGTVKIVVQ